MCSTLKHHLLWSFLLLLLTGCGPMTWDTPYQTYLERLSQTLKQTHTTPIFAIPERMPRPAKLRHKFETGSLDGLDFLALHGCELQITIGKKNSSLGRTARDSQRLLLDLEYLQLAPACITHLQEKDEQALASTLQQAWNDKRRQLPQRIFNATLAGEEYRAFWQPRSPEPAYPRNTSSAVIEAMDQINSLARQWLNGDYRFDNMAFEILLSEVGKGDGGMLWYALGKQYEWLESANIVVTKRLDEGPLCAGKIRPAAADILPTVVSRFFVDGIQEQAADMGRRHHQLLPPQHKLETLLSAALPQPYQDWQSQRDARLSVLSAAPRRHVQHLQALLQPCSGAGK